MNHQSPHLYLWPVPRLTSDARIFTWKSCKKKNNALKKLHAPKNETKMRSACGEFYLLGKVAQLGQLIQQFLQVSVGNLVLETWDERLGLLSIVAAQTTCAGEDPESVNPLSNLPSNAMQAHVP
jgi:hypothetical protein